MGGKNVRISDFGRKITLNFGEDIRIFEGLCLKSPPPKFSSSATGMGPPQSKILATPMALDGFSTLLFIPPAPKVLAEIKTTIPLGF